MSLSLPSNALWIWPESLHWNLHNCYALFRREFKLDELPKHAPLLITADQSYQLYINGLYVCRGPARGFQASWPYDEIDIRPWLVVGSNLIAIRAYNPGGGNFQYVSQGYAGLLVVAQWQDFSLVTDGCWKCRRQEGIRKDTVPISLQLFPQEIIDLGIEDPDWMMPAFDDTSWKTSVASTPWNAMPWPQLEARSIPMLDEHEIQTGSLIGYAKGVAAEDYISKENLSLLRYEQGLQHESAEGDTDTLQFESTPKGYWQSKLIDLGKPYIGSVLLEVIGADSGVIVETHHYETIQKESLCPDFASESHSKMAFSHRMICRDGKNYHAFYHPFGFRYMVVTVYDNESEIQVKPSLRTSVYPLKDNGYFKSADDDLNRIWETCAWTQRICSLDAYVDTPWREQAQWWGDARVQAWNTFHLDGDVRLFRRGIKQIATQTTPDGLTYGHAPTIAHFCILPDFTLIWMVTLWDCYWQTGSLEAFETHRDKVEKALDYFRDHMDSETGLLRYDERFWLFLDWTDLQKAGCSSVYSLWLLYALIQLEKLYELTDDLKSASECHQWSNRLRDSLLALVGEDGLIRDGFLEDGTINPHASIHAQTLSLMTGLCPENEPAMLNKCLLPFLKGELEKDVQPSAYWITYVYTVLAERGYVSDVVGHIREKWKPMIEQGATWENFEPKRGNESFSHAWSAHPLFHLMQCLGGIRQIDKGWSRVSFSPVFKGKHATVTIPTPLGKIKSSWEKIGKEICGELILPQGIQAEVRLVGLDSETIEGVYQYRIENIDSR
ncbi:alpha-L-rhamnosidase C-terminal domain-containing protein [Rubellicoccus peritrichatus]|uniref:Alpha-L-rhamnosidase C-terminal domain-containing protein n=1 Tax=Rubellicoccus peritrichatus TaxID=3080537 RepID=A0AAQ3LFC5_9BACT|nr:alpha-L-rhamnosidase C-terminal domain-containing protein [Puniceicoccus sp. CR14]WOO43672.1 alpha-L-rhamnosidase C-terminal domain-containing protein [Puniceicoccus sp. CR14]